VTGLIRGVIIVSGQTSAQQAAENLGLHIKHGEKMTDGAMASKISGCSKRPTSKAQRAKKLRRMLRYVEPLHDVRTPVMDFFGILLVDA
jgi:hypothetical protein